MLQTISPGAFDSDGSLVQPPGSSLMVLFFAPWCPHCEAILPAWRQLQDHRLRQARPNCVMAAVDCSRTPVPFVKAYPTIYAYDADGRRHGVSALGIKLKAARLPAAQQATLAMFYAPWCGFCRKAMPAVAAFQKANPGVPVLRIDCDANRDVAREWGVHAFPTFQVIWRDRQAVQVGGGVTAMDVQRFYQQALAALR